MTMLPEPRSAKSSSRLVFLGMLLITTNVMLCCSSHRTSAQNEPVLASSSNIMLFDGSLCRKPDVIFSVVSADSQALENVDVYLVGPTGTKLLGRTDPLGAICISYEEISAPSTQAILFCADWFFCGGFLIAHEDFSKYRDRLIVLAPFTVK